MPIRLMAQEVYSNPYDFTKTISLSSRIVGIAVDGSGNIYATDNNDGTVLEITAAGVVSTFLDNTVGLSRPIGVGVDSSGNVYVADSGNSVIRKVSSAGVVSIFAGSFDYEGVQDGTGAAASFILPYGIAVAQSGNIYVSDSASYTIRKISPTGEVSTIAGRQHLAGYVDGAGASAEFASPLGIAVDTSENVYVADSGNNVIRMVANDAYHTVSTIAGIPGVQLSQDGPSGTGSFDSPSFVAVNPDGTLIVTDGSLAIRLAQNGVISSIAGNFSISGTANGIGSSVRFFEPIGVAVDSSGTLYVADQGADQVREGTPPAGPTPTPTPTPTSTVTSTPSPTPTPTPTGSNSGSPTPAPSLVPTPTPMEVLNGAPIIGTNANSQTVQIGQHVLISVAVSGIPTPSLQWSLNDAPISGATSATYAIASASLADAGSYTVTATNSAGTATSAGSILAVQGSGSPNVSHAPSPQNIAYGSTVVFSVEVDGTVTTSAAEPIEGRQPRLSQVGGIVPTVSASANTFQWYFNGVPVQGATSTSLVVSGATYASQGLYSCVVANTAGSTATGQAQLTVTSTLEPGRLVNISTRGLVKAGDALMIAGFVTMGASDEPLLIRASGPALDALGVAGSLADPELTLIGGGSSLGSNAGWGGGSLIANEAASVGAFPWGTAGSADSAIATSLPAGAYTANVAGVSGDSGIALVEVYDATQSSLVSPSSTQLVNISTRGFVGTGANVMIAGFVIEGSTAETVLIRASGPALIPFSIAGTLPDPSITLNTGQTSLLTNTGWNGDPNIAMVAKSLGAFSWGTAATPDSALLVTLPPGNYTVTVSGASGDTGIALVEVYAVN